MLVIMKIIKKKIYFHNLFLITFFIFIYNFNKSKKNKKNTFINIEKLLHHKEDLSLKIMYFIKDVIMFDISFKNKLKNNELSYIPLCTCIMLIDYACNIIPIILWRIFPPVNEFIKEKINIISNKLDYNFFSNKFIKLKTNKNNKEKESDGLRKVDNQFRELENYIKNEFENKSKIPKNGVLLHGPSGSGKKHMINIIAEENNINIGEINFSDISLDKLKKFNENSYFLEINKYDFENQLINFFKNKSNSKYIVLINDLDLKAPKIIKNKKSSLSYRTDLLFFLHLIEKLLKLPNVVLICFSSAENPLDKLNKSIIGSGKINKYYKIDYPDENKINYIIKKTIKEEEIEINNNIFLKLLSFKLFQKKSSIPDILIFINSAKNDLKKLIITNEIDEEKLENNINELLNNHLNN
jgi:hypothetical protein